jgi:hypothetical protein
MWVDISELINDVGVGQYIDIQMLQDNADTGDFGVVEESTDSKLSLKNIYCTMVENVDDVVSSQDGSYISRVTYDFYIPAKFSLGYDLEGSTIRTKDGRKFTVTHRPINQAYVSHCVLTATEDKLNYGGAN